MAKSIRLAWLGLSLLVCCANGVAEGRKPVKVWQGTLDLPVYTEGSPDVNPPLDQFGGAINYPYTLRQNLTGKKEDQKLRAIYLENEYLKCSVLPDLGGHIYTCLDKISGQPMFYANPSIKKARISYRGAWSAFGDEFNFPVSHNWVSLSPVNFGFQALPDGSASVTVSNVDRVYGMQWTVEMVLRPGDTVLRENVTLSNRTDVRHRFYYWNNAGIEVWNDSRICYPTHFTAAHFFADVDTWPVNSKGQDLSVYGNQQYGPVSRFVHESREPFIGVWHPHTNSGVAHFAEYDQLPGKKFWSWGDDAPGREWRKILSDNNSAYVEVQAGPFRNQETYGYLEPHESMHFSEYWIPVRGLGGIARVNLDAAANLNHEGNAVRVAVNANHAIAGARIRLMQGGTKLWEEKSDLLPEKTWTKTSTEAAQGVPSRVEIVDKSGTVLLAQTEGEYDTTPAAEVKTGPQQPPSFPEPAKRTSDQWLWFGDNQERFGNTLGALAAYQQGLASYPGSLSLEIAAARLLLALGRDQEALALLEPVRQVETTGAEIAYYLGVAYSHQGRDRKARTMFEAATRLEGRKAAAFLQLAELSSRKGDLAEALRYADMAQKLSPWDERIAEEHVALLQATHASAAQDALSAATVRFPASVFLKELSGKSDFHHLAADPYRVLQVATEFMHLGMYERALQVLSREYPQVPDAEREPGALLPQQHPVVLYYHAYCQQKLGRNPDAALTAAAAASTKFAFPRGAYDAEVLAAAVKMRPQDANAHWLLGMDEFSRGLESRGMEEWSRAAELNPHLPALFAVRGKNELLLRHDASAALSEFQRGRTNDPLNPDVYVGSDQAMSLLRRDPKEIGSMLATYPDSHAMTQGMVYELALARAEAKDFQGASQAFQGRYFSSGEGDTDVRQIWLEVQLQEALSKALHGQCEVALQKVSNLSAPAPGLSFTEQILPAMTSGSRMRYLIGETERTCRQSEKARESFKLAASSTAPDDVYWAVQAAKRLPAYNPAVWKQRLSDAYDVASAKRGTTGDASYWTYVMAMIDRELGRTAEANQLMEEVFRMSDRMLAYHLTRIARSESYRSPVMRSAQPRKRGTQD